MAGRVASEGRRAQKAPARGDASAHWYGPLVLRRNCSDCLEINGDRIPVTHISSRNTTTVLFLFEILFQRPLCFVPEQVRSGRHPTAALAALVRLLTSLTMLKQ